MKKLVIVLAAIIIAGVAHANFDWSNYWYFYDEGGVNFATNASSSTVGFFVQLIWDVDDDGLDAPVTTTATGISTTSDDMVYWVSWLGENDGGTGMPGDFGGSNPETVTAGAAQDANHYYARVWNAPATTAFVNTDTNTAVNGLGTTARYWDGLEFTYADGAPQTYVMTGGAGSPYNSNITIDSVPIPEPTTFALLGIGLLAARFVRKK